MHEILEFLITRFILSMADDDLIDLEMHGGRFYLFGSSSMPLIGLNKGSCDNSMYHESISHLISIPCGANQYLRFDEETEEYISNTPEYIRGNLIREVGHLYSSFMEAIEIDEQKKRQSIMDAVNNENL